jgi:hypothetical protein
LWRRRPAGGFALRVGKNKNAGETPAPQNLSFAIPIFEEYFEGLKRINRRLKPGADSASDSPARH